MNMIQRAIFRELIQYFFLSVVALNFVLMMEKVLRLSRILSGIGASLPDMVKIILYLQPQIMLLTVPMALLIATLLTYGRLNADNELTVLRSAGMSFFRISAPVFVLGIICFIMGLLTGFIFGPSGAAKVRETVSAVLMQRAPLSVEAGVFNTLFKDIVILVRDKPGPEEIEGIFIYDSRNKAEPKVLAARRGKFSADSQQNLSIFLREGYINFVRPGGVTEIFFDGYNFTLNLTYEGPSRKRGEMSPSELYVEAGMMEGQERIALLLELNRRFSLPALCLVLMFLSPPLSLLAGKTGRLGGLTIGLGVFTVYYIVLVYGENMARTGKIHYLAGAWLPALFISLLAYLAFRKGDSR